ncbi:MAG: bifunctional demethylmenaquinone methyltransferase/2-methoxy-6-polyprenyl-1,4-benzoquinol methylase UbiE [Chloroflexota bacterium]
MKGKQYPSVAKATTAEHIGMVKEIFGTITERYDFLNHFLSLRRDFFWRRFAVQHMRFFQTQRLLDVACGTGDLAMDAALRYPYIEAVGLDFVKEMMVKARSKLSKAGLTRRIRLVLGDATGLPFADDSFDVVSIGFGIRNIPDRLRALQEMTRVAAPGGQVLVLEMTVPSNRNFRMLHIFYLEQILPRLARSFTANANAYIYLADSIKNFPPPDQFAALMAEAGLTEVKKYPLTLGITYLFSGVKPSI